MEVKLRNSTETIEEMIASEVCFMCVKDGLKGMIVFSCLTDFSNFHLKQKL